MIRMTRRAHDVVRRVTAHKMAGGRSGLRIAARGPRTETLHVGTASRPEPGDQVVEQDGARIYLDRVAEPRVDGHLLDAVTEDTGRVHFVVKRS
ncbi:Fe-S cluster assembly iron-binding protein IscA [Nocardioides sp. BE266]|uniref:hypothetical protein n=1 Tax=Nocardioides sp. BE266 TaxID=2817725 RepID=UPI00285CB067|nr:hypothetical protein [Nocardioides sp. BE266]MDR7252606.1 Fe-S cluster assembly iron-binding protein IscA [Nocardioides sp. BE266]